MKKGVACKVSVSEKLNCPSTNMRCKSTLPEITHSLQTREYLLSYFTS